MQRDGRTGRANLPFGGDSTQPSWAMGCCCLPCREVRTSLFGWTINVVFLAFLFGSLIAGRITLTKAFGCWLLVRRFGYVLCLVLIITL